MKHTLMAAMFAVAALSLGAADGLFKKACPVWLAEPEAVGDAQTVPFGKWIGLDETDTTLRIASDRPVRINFEWKLVGWIPGDGMAHDFPIIGGKGMHELRLVCDAKAKWLVAEVWRANGDVIVFTGDPKTKGGLTMNSWFSKQVPSKDDPSKMVSKGVPPVEVEATVAGLAEGFAPKTSLFPFKHKGDRHWLYHVVRGKDATFVSGVRARGIPSASIRCNQPGVLVVKWGGKPGESARVEAKKEGGVLVLRERAPGVRQARLHRRVRRVRAQRRRLHHAHRLRHRMLLACDERREDQRRFRRRQDDERPRAG